MLNMMLLLNITLW